MGTEWDLFLRAAAAVQQLVRRPAGSYLIVSHGAILAAAFRSIFGISPPSGRIRPLRVQFSNTGYSIFKYESGDARWSLFKHNVTTHLEEAGDLEGPIDE
ncbi:MAG: histidine phosphatase family protein [Anaerolineales bacterium]